MVVITTYWIKCFPLPKKVIIGLTTIYAKKIVWTCSNTTRRKSPIAWKTVCTPKNKGGINIISLEEWNNAKMIKILWNLSGNAYNL